MAGCVRNSQENELEEGYKEAEGRRSDEQEVNVLEKTCRAALAMVFSREATAQSVGG